LYFKDPDFYLLILVQDHDLVLFLLGVEVKEDLEEEVGFQCLFPVEEVVVADQE
jgi:fused signal recognition particle receptor